MRKILFFILFIVFTNAGTFYQKNVEELFNGFKIRKTIETLEALKKLYPINSTPYLKIQAVENYFMKNLPIDAYSTYVRIKLRNIIDSTLEQEKSEKQKQLEKSYSKYLTPNTNLDLLLKRKKMLEEEIKQKNEINKQTLGNTNLIPGQAPNNLKEQIKEGQEYQEILNKMKQYIPQ